MKSLIIGSVAQYHWFSDSRIPNDIDFLSPDKFSVHNESVRIESQWHDIASYIISINKDKVFVDPDILFTIKVSHAHWNIKWEKTMYDIHFLQSKNCELNEELYDRLAQCWKNIHGKKLVNLNQKVEDFSNDHVIRKYNHEYLHQLVKFRDKPGHEYIRNDLSNVFCDRDLFFNLSYEQQLEICLEEILVTAIERKHLTEKCDIITILKAINFAYFNLVTSMTSGWFSKFLILNHRQLLSKEKQKWMLQLKSTLKILSN